MNPAQSPVSVEREIAGRVLKIETGRLARQAHGSVTVHYGDSVAFVAVTTGEANPNFDFFPLTVDYREMTSAAGKIPGGFFKREGRPTTKETLTCRLIDRPIRPLFPEGFKDDVLIQARVFSADRDNDADILAVIGASAALSISKVPFEGPVGAVRIGKIGDGPLIVNPTFLERDTGDLDLVVAGTRGAICMVEAGANELPEDIMLEALMKGHEVCREVAAMIEELVSKCDVNKIVFVPSAPDTEAREIVAVHAATIRALNTTPGKHQRKEKIKEARVAALESFFAERKIGEDDSDARKEWKRRFSNAWEDLTTEVIRRSIIEDNVRPDSRRHDEIRPITVEVSAYPRTHGSCLFTRGETQAFVSATLGTIRDEQRIEMLHGEVKQAFMLHYNFPSYSVGETWPNRGPKRREIGHGALAERALEPVIPEFAKFPYSLRVVSEILESNGSSSMATVCGGTLALMDAGVAIRRPVAGIAMGLIKDGDQVVVLSDILGTEDHIGDMDFKVAGTQRGITALQMDIKIKGMEREVLETALKQARDGRLHILKTMLAVLPAPRPTTSPFAPRIVTMPIDPEKVGLLIGPGGKTIRRIQEETSTKIEVAQSDNAVCIIGDMDSKLDLAVSIVRDLIRDIEIGAVYTGRVMSIKDFGAFIEILPGKEGLLPVEEFGAPRGVRITLSEHLNLGDSIQVKVIDVDPLGRVRLSKRALMAEADGAAPSRR